MPLIKSVYNNQEELIKSLMELYEVDRFELDPTYSCGNFYKNIKEPIHKYDKYPVRDDVKYADATDLLKMVV